MRAIALLLLLTLGAFAATARAQDVIHRCVDAHGNPVFTDQTCSSQNATPVQDVQKPAPAGVVAAPGMPVPLHRCAGTEAELRQRVIDAFAARDPNQLAGLMLWHGYGHHSAVDDLRALAQLVRQPLLEIHFDNEADDDSDADTPAAASSAAPPANALRVSTDSGGADFGIARQAGCLWLLYGD